MKKSTKIILIASGTVIFVSVVLIIVLALTIRAANNARLPTPPGPTPVSNACPPINLTATISTSRAGISSGRPVGTFWWEVPKDIKDCILNEAKKNNINIYKPFEENQIRFKVWVVDQNGRTVLYDTVGYRTRAYGTDEMTYGINYRIAVDLIYPDDAGRPNYYFGRVTTDLYVPKEQELTGQPADGDLPECAPQVKANIYRRQSGASGFDTWLAIRVTETSATGNCVRCGYYKVTTPDGREFKGAIARPGPTRDILIQSLKPGDLAGEYTIDTHTNSNAVCGITKLQVSDSDLQYGVSTTTPGGVPPTGPNQPGGPGTGPSSGEFCSDNYCEQFQGRVFTSLKYITCEIQCGIFRAVLWCVNTAYNFMVKYSGLEPNRELLPGVTGGGGTNTGGGTTDIQSQAIELCNQKKSTYSSTDWEKGPCLTNDLNGSKYAVDVAHKPRQAVDNQNTCPSPTKWIELDTSCSVIGRQD